jgi:putative transposase
MLSSTLIQNLIRCQMGSIVRGDSSELKRLKQRQEISTRSLSKRVEPGNLSAQDIKVAIS